MLTPSLDWARWNGMKICMLHNTMPLKIKLWKFLTFRDANIGSTELHEILMLLPDSQSPSTGLNFLKIKQFFDIYDNRPNPFPNSLVCRGKRKVLKVNLKRRNILSSQEGGKTPETRKKPIHNVQVTVKFPLWVASRVKIPTTSSRVHGWLERWLNKAREGNGAFSFFTDNGQKTLSLFTMFRLFWTVCSRKYWKSIEKVLFQPTKILFICFTPLYSPPTIYERISERWRETAARMRATTNRSGWQENNLPTY